MIEETLELLKSREASASEPYWLIDGEDRCYCRDCLAALYPDADPERDIEAWYEKDNAENALYCYGCRRLLAYTLSEWGVRNEIGLFLDRTWDWTDPIDCYRIARIIEASPGSGYRARQIKRLIREGRFAPPEYKALEAEWARA